MPTGNYDKQLRRFAAHSYSRAESSPGVDAETCSERHVCASLDALFCVCSNGIRQLRIEGEEPE